MTALTGQQITSHFISWFWSYTLFNYNFSGFYMFVIQADVWSGGIVFNFHWCIINYVFFTRCLYVLLIDFVTESILFFWTNDTNIV